MRAGDLAQADAASATALAADGGNGMALAVRADILRRQGKAAEADRMQALSRDRDPRSAEIVRMIEAR